MKRIGLTGGIACGKSSVAQILRNFSVPVLDADQVARDVVQPGAPALREITARFGDHVLQEDGALNRERLGALVMADAAARRDLEAITHPRIFEACEAWFTDQEAAGHKAAVVEAALMVETGSWRLYDTVLVVTCSPVQQRARLIARKGVDEATAQRWIDSQLPLAQKEAIATAVIPNEDWGNPPDPSALESRVRQAWQQVLQTSEG